MKCHPPLLIALLAFSLAAPAAQAQTAPKIVFFDLTKLFETDWKTQQEEVKLDADAIKFVKESQRMEKDFLADEQQVEPLRKQAGPLTPQALARPGVIDGGAIKIDMRIWNPSDYTNPKAAAAAQEKEQELESLRLTMPQSQEKFRKQMLQRMDAFKRLMFDEISKVAIGIAKAHGGMILVDKSGPTLVGVSNIVYCDPSLDITDEVMAAINKDRPAHLPKAGLNWADGFPTNSSPASLPGP